MPYRAIRKAMDDVRRVALLAAVPALVALVAIGVLVAGPPGAQDEALHVAVELGIVAVALGAVAWLHRRRGRRADREA